MSNKRVAIQCVVVDILESNLRCLVNYNCIHECTLTILARFFKIYTCSGSKIFMDINWFMENNNFHGHKAWRHIALIFLGLFFIHKTTNTLPLEKYSHHKYILLNRMVWHQYIVLLMEVTVLLFKCY